MRPHLLAATFAALLPLASCQQAEDAFRSEFRQQSIAACLEQSRGAAPAAMQGLDWQRFCACGVDRFMEGKSMADLAAVRDGSGIDRQATEQCAREVLGAPGAAPAEQDGG